MKCKKAKPALIKH